MAIIQNDGKRERRRPSLRGGVMLDVVNGNERARAWPKKRGKKLHPNTIEQNEWFRQAQWATKFMPAEMYWQVAQAVQGTPLLPRDILTMMMAGRLLSFTLDSGTTIWSVQVANDVSQALDVITDQPGAMLVRGLAGWQALLPGSEGYVLTAGPEGELPEWQASGGGGGGSAGFISEIVAVGGETDLIIPTIPTGHKDVILTFSNMRCATGAAPNNTVRVQLNADTGANYVSRRFNNFGSSLITGNNPEICGITPASGPAGASCSGEVRFVGYDDPGAALKPYMGNLVTAIDLGATFVAEVVSGGWKAAANITSARFFITGATFAAGSTVRLYGAN